MSAISRIAMIEVSIEWRDEGRIYISSPDLPGLHLSGTNVSELCGDIAQAIEVLIEKNHGMKVKAIPVEDDWRNFNAAPLSNIMPKRLALQMAA